ncbi:hypothetical protein TrRE_jg11425 [Triparma retinervis]|uniref:Uncharacterized protein n=1 Tax=Triparma retinervis TaxID=2557542 RepID=A0A9W6ZD85_9STRA|nr:hypothetical protein TrRE_jg11425 [Triparma retinervis]
MTGTTDLQLRKDRVAVFGTGETGVWGVKSRPSLPSSRGSSRGSSRSPSSQKGARSDDQGFGGGVCLEIEVTEAKDGPVVVYSIPLATGLYQPQALRLGTGTVKYLRGQLSLKGETVGECRAELVMGKGMVDKGWAKGRKWWWGGLR